MSSSGRGHRAASRYDRDWPDPSFDAWRAFLDGADALVQAQAGSVDVNALALIARGLISSSVSPSEAETLLCSAFTPLFRSFAAQEKKLVYQIGLSRSSSSDSERVLVEFYWLGAELRRAFDDALVELLHNEWDPSRAPFLVFLARNRPGHFRLAERFKRKLAELGAEFVRLDGRSGELIPLPSAPIFDGDFVPESFDFAQSVLFRARPEFGGERKLREMVIDLLESSELSVRDFDELLRPDERAELLRFLEGVAELGERARAALVKLERRRRYVQRDSFS